MTQCTTKPEVEQAEDDDVQCDSVVHADWIERSRYSDTLAAKVHSLIEDDAHSGRQEAYIAGLEALLARFTVDGFQWNKKATAAAAEGRPVDDTPWQGNQGPADTVLSDKSFEALRDFTTQYEEDLMNVLCGCNDLGLHTAYIEDLRSLTAKYKELVTGKAAPEGASEANRKAKRGVGSDNCIYGAEWLFETEAPEIWETLKRDHSVIVNHLQACDQIGAALEPIKDAIEILQAGGRIKALKEVVALLRAAGNVDNDSPAYRTCADCDAEYNTEDEDKQATAAD